MEVVNFQKKMFCQIFLDPSDKTSTGVKRSSGVINVISGRFFKILNNIVIP